jgi:hypothetical protein
MPRTPTPPAAEGLVMGDTDESVDKLRFRRLRLRSQPLDTGQPSVPLRLIKEPHDRPADRCHDGHRP